MSAATAAVLKELRAAVVKEEICAYQAQAAGDGARGVGRVSELQASRSDALFSHSQCNVGLLSQSESLVIPPTSVMTHES